MRTGILATRTLCSAFCFALLAALSSSAQAAVITWGTPTGIAADSDVSTTGTLVRAFHFGTDSAVSATVNTVLFEPFDLSSTTTIGNFSISGGGLGAGGTAFAAPPFSNLSASYQQVLGSKARGFGKITLTLSNLTTNLTYAVQVWVNDSTDGRFGGDETGDQIPDYTFPVIVYDGEANDVELDANPTITEGGVGQFVIGTFVATGTTQFIEFDESEIGGMVNAFQLRQLDVLAAVPEPASAVAWLAFSLAGTGWFARRRLPPARAN